MNTSTEVAGLTFRRPILVSSSEFALSPSQCENLLQRPIGGIITKRFTTAQENRLRLRRHQFPLDHFEREYGQALLSLAGPHVQETVVWSNHGMATPFIESE